ncbi:hypothetical protein [Crenobacter caeni]|uniref:Uncharacterized protein n=1 Tax=Crenobacter caeni TaxID=2705474 RepID=A0A6B2KVP8_9NEIS|nr:hypothetical protein [Crenobacter caeni]NDV14079.1 hypothetical protein [Crenobacter caeni]
MRNKRKRYRLDDLLAEMPEGMPRDEAWEAMGEVGAEVLDEAPKRIGALKGKLQGPGDFDAPSPEVESLFGAMAGTVQWEGDIVSPLDDDAASEVSRKPR